MNRISKSDVAAPTQRFWITVWVLVGLVIASMIAVLVWAFFDQKRSDEDAAVNAANFSVTHAGPNGGVVVAGSGPIKVDVYLDFQCPGCQSFELGYGDVLDDMASENLITYTQHTMTFLDANLNNTSSTRAAAAATCVSNVSQEFYREYGMEVFRNMEHGGSGVETFSDELLLDTIPRQIGMDDGQVRQVEQCAKQELPASFLEDVNRGAYEAGVKQTPTLMVNGKQIENATFPESPAMLREMILTAGR